MKNKKYSFKTSSYLFIIGFALLLFGSSLEQSPSESKKGIGSLFALAGIGSGTIGFFGLILAFDESTQTPKKEQKDYTNELLIDIKKHLASDEKVEKYITFLEVQASSFVTEQYLGLVAATNKRIIIYKSKLGGHKIKSLNYSKVSAVEYEQGLLFDSLEFSTSGEKLSIDKINQGSTAEFVSFVNSKI